MQKRQESARVTLDKKERKLKQKSKGHLPNNLTVEKILSGISNIRNPILVSFVAKGLLPYHGLGSGIKRALDAWPQIDFTDDRDGCLFTAKIHRTPVQALKLVPGSPEVSEKRRKRFWTRVGKETPLPFPNWPFWLG